MPDAAAPGALDAAFDVVVAMADLPVPPDRRAALRDEWVELMRFVRIVRAAELGEAGLDEARPEGFGASAGRPA